jgi:hypothetical protein
VSDDLFNDPSDLWLDVEASKKNVGQFANRIFVQPLGNGMVRINLGEVLDDDPSYHTAIVVTAEQGMQFASLIHSISNKVRQEDVDAFEAALAVARGSNGTNRP